MSTRTVVILLTVFCGLAALPPAVAQDANPVENPAASPAATQPPTPLFATVSGADQPQVRGARMGFSLDTKETIAAKDIQVRIGGFDVGPVSRARDGFTFLIPRCSTSTVPLGKHDIDIEYAPKASATSVLAQFASGTPQLEIQARTGGITPPVIKGVFPMPAYPQEKGAVYNDLRIQGEGFARDACDNEVALGGEWIQVCWEGAKCAADAVLGKLISTREIRLSNLTLGDHDFSTIRVGVGGHDSEPVDMRLSRVARGIPLAWALVGFVAIVALVLFTTSQGFGGETIAGTKYGFPAALLLDSETNTYSLSRLQFYVWTSVAIFGYFYLAISRSLVQGHLEFVDIPSGLPGIILISASTSMLATWTTSSRGPKGAGNEKPSFSDLITTGGLVAPERFQFFVWTIVGAAAFLALVVLRDPGTINDLPAVPDGFLQLMGVSSAGYLGGKLARKPGPVIQEILPVRSSLKLTIRGRNLSRDASFRIGDDIVRSDQVSGDAQEAKPKILEAEADPVDKTMAKTIELTIKEPLDEWLKDDVELTIINPDGQKASRSYKFKAQVEQKVLNAAAPPAPPDGDKYKL
jgi:hypothetical protein